MKYNDQTSCQLASRLYCCIFIFSNTLTQDALTHTNIIQSCQTDSKRQLTACGAKRTTEKPAVVTVVHLCHDCFPLFSCYISVSIFCLKCHFHPLTLHSVHILVLYNDSCLGEDVMWSNHAKEMKNDIPAVQMCLLTPVAPIVSTKQQLLFLIVIPHVFLSIAC